MWEIGEEDSIPTGNTVLVFVVGAHTVGAAARALGSGGLELTAGPIGLPAAALRWSLQCCNKPGSTRESGRHAGGPLPRLKYCTFCSESG